MGKRKLKPQVKAILIILGAILALIILENLLSLIGDFIRTKKAEAEYEKQQELYQQTPEYQEEQYVIKCIEKAMEYIKTKNYIELYNRLDEEYKEVFEIDSLEKFETILENYLGENPENAVLYDYELNDSKYLCNVSIQNQEGSVIKKILIIPDENNEEEFKIIVDDIISITNYAEESLGASGGKRMAFRLLYKINKGTEHIYVFSIENRTANSMLVSLNETTLSKSNHSVTIPQNTEELKNIELQPNILTKVSLVFPKDKNYKYNNKIMKFILKDSNGNLVEERDFDMYGAGAYQ